MEEIEKKLGLMARINDFIIDHSKVTVRDKSYFFHMLAVMVDAGIPVVDGIKVLASRSINPRFARILSTVAYNAEQGATISDSMMRFSDVFTESEIGIVKSGEMTGRLDQMLFKLSRQLDKTSDLNMKLWAAAVYPMVVFAVLLIVAVGMLVWVFPTLLSLLSEGGVSESQLPFATRLLIGIENAIVGYWWLILLIGFSLYGLFVMYRNTDYGAYRWDYFKLRMPLVGALLRKIYVLRFVGILGLLIESGLPVLQAMEITGNALSNRIYKLNTRDLIENVRVGGRISDGLLSSSFLFPPEVVQMIRVGEQSASLGKISEKISDQYQREVDNSLKKLTSVFEPLMILFVGLFVALLAMAIMAPIFNLSSTVVA